jgi:DNA polymerase-3 subunit epsilon
MFDGPVAFVDVETTGGRAGWDRVIEIGLVTATGGLVEHEWSTLVDSGARIPFGVQQLTGISDEMVRDAPSFEVLAPELFERLRGRLFVAHNARFDYSFLRGEFRRVGLKFSSTVACTVKLSRRLYPEERHHNLDAVIERHGLHCPHRHRALPDAQALWQFWDALRAQGLRDEVGKVLDEIALHATAPAHLPQTLPDELPEEPGVYLFYGADGSLLYVGKSGDIRQGVLDHWQLARRSPRARKLAELTARVEWIETTGELGARMAHARFISESQPRFNRAGRTRTKVARREVSSETARKRAMATVEGAPGVTELTRELDETAVMLDEPRHESGEAMANSSFE